MFNIFKKNRKSYSELEAENLKLNESCELLKKQLDEVQAANEDLFKLDNKTCKKGDYCKGCNFYGTRTITNYSFLTGEFTTTLKYCTKDLCPSFIKRTEI